MLYDPIWSIIFAIFILSLIVSILRFFINIIVWAFVRTSLLFPLSFVEAVKTIIAVFIVLIVMGTFISFFF